jgi:uncharacterized protein (UPF0332 family)
MKEEIERLRSAAAADLVQVDAAFAAGNFRRGLATLYYVAFYYVQAVLLTRGLSFRSHGQTIGAFQKDFVKAGAFPPSAGKLVQELFTVRQGADYKLIEYGETYAADLRAKTAVFIAAADDYLKRSIAH